MVCSKKYIIQEQLCRLNTFCLDFTFVHGLFSLICPYMKAGVHPRGLFSCYVVQVSASLWTT